MLLSEESISFLNRSKEELERRQKELEDCQYDIQKFINDKFLKDFQLKNVTVQARVKGSKSLREKTIRKMSFIDYRDEVVYIKSLDDLIGIRLICLLEKEEVKVFDLIDTKFTHDVGNGYYIIPISTQTEFPYMKINKLDQPFIQKNGKEIYKMKCQWITETTEINVELQIKSLSHTFWGEVEHMLFYKNYAYTVGAGFYSDMMNSVAEILHSVDHQLEVLSEHLSVKDESKQVDEIKEMVTKLMYSTYQPIISAMTECEIDLRQVYELVVEIMFLRKNDRETALITANDIITKLNNGGGHLTEETFSFDEYKSRNSHINLTELSGFINILVQGPDIYWKTFFAIIKLIKGERDQTLLSDNLIVDLMHLYYFKDDFTDIENVGTMILIDGITKGLIDYFTEYKKIDFFCPKVFQDEILGKISNFIAKYQGEFLQINISEISDEKVNDVKTLIAFYLKIKIDFVIEKKIAVSELGKLNGWLMLKNMLWLPTINIKELKKLQVFGNYITEEHFEKLYKVEGDDPGETIY